MYGVVVHGQRGSKMLDSQLTSSFKLHDYAKMWSMLRNAVGSVNDSWYGFFIGN